MNTRRSTLGGLGGTVFLIGLVLAIVWNPFNLPVFFAGIAFASLLGSLGSGKRQGAFGGLYGFTWFMALSMFFLFHHWVWFLVAVIVSGLLSSVIGGMSRARSSTPVHNPPPQQPYYQPSKQQEERQPETPYYQPYDRGYQSMPPQPSIYRQGGESQQSQIQDYEQPQAQYPEQQMPPQQ